MRSCLIAAVSVTYMLGMAAPAQACVYSPPIDLNDVRHANLVVVGRIVNYRIVEDGETRRDPRILNANWPGLSRQEQQRRAQHTRFLTDYARFDVVVEEALVGQPARILTVLWDNSTFNEPESMQPGRYLIALRRMAGPVSPTGTSRTNAFAGALTPVQSSCSTAFIFEETSRQARGVREILSRQ